MIRDPVTEFEYPQAWVDACGDPGELALAESGFGVLTSSGKVLRRGFTTGTTAAAACKAAVLSLEYALSSVRVVLPCGLQAVIPVDARDGTASVKKDPGDYREDVTGGLLFIARAEIGGKGPCLIAGEGIGRFQRDTPRYGKGDAAISPPASSSIDIAIGEAMNTIGARGIRVTLEIPAGAEIGARTLNPKVGVEGGISVLGTTGLVEPWDDHLSESAFERIARAGRVVLTTGRLGLRYSRMLFPDHEVVLVGKFIGKGISRAQGEVVLCGLPALILKFVDPCILEGTGYGTVEELSASPDFSSLMEGALRDFKHRAPHVRVVIVDRKGQILGDSG